MRIDRVVVNASPLITLFRSGQFDFLPGLFNHIIVPEAVWEEVVIDTWNDPAARQLGDQPWAARQTVEVSPRVAVWNLGAGETAVLRFALAQPSYRAMVDDREARRCARTLGLRTLSTAGMLVLAKRRGLIASVETGVVRLRDAGLWLSDEVVRVLLRQAGE